MEKVTPAEFSSRASTLRVRHRLATWAWQCGHVRRPLIVLTAIVFGLLVVILLADRFSGRTSHPIGEVSVLGDAIAAGHCVRGPKLEVVEESPTAIIVGFSYRGEPYGDCLKCEIARTSQPVGARRIIDEMTGEEISREDACLDFLRDRS